MASSCLGPNELTRLFADNTFLTRLLIGWRICYRPLKNAMQETINRFCYNAVWRKVGWLVGWLNRFIYRANIARAPKLATLTDHPVKSLQLMGTNECTATCTFGDIKKHSVHERKAAISTASSSMDAFTANGSRQRLRFVYLPVSGIPEMTYLIDFTISSHGLNSLRPSDAYMRR